MQGDDISKRLYALEQHIETIERCVQVPTWKKILYGLGITFVTFSATRYWINKMDERPPAYILPCVQPEAPGGNYGR